MSAGDVEGAADDGGEFGGKGVVRCVVVAGRGGGGRERFLEESTEVGDFGEDAGTGGGLFESSGFGADAFGEVGGEFGGVGDAAEGVGGGLGVAGGLQHCGDEC